MTKRLGVLLLAFVIAGCAPLWQTEEKIDHQTQSVDAIRALTERNATDAAVIRTKRARLSGEEVSLKGNVLPAVFSKNTSYVTKGSQTLAQTLEDIAATTGIPIKRMEIVQSGQPGMMPPNGGMNSGNDALSGSVSLEYSGTVKGLFDEIASKANVTWRYDEHSRVVEFFRFETRTLSLYLPAGAKDMNASISLSGVTSGGSGGGASGSAGNLAVSQQVKIDPWSSIMQGVKTILNEGHSASAAGQGAAPPGGAGMAMLSVSGPSGSAIANPELGLMTITARPTTIDRVARYVASINDKFAQNVLIDVKIYSVSINNDSSLGFTLNMLYSAVDKLGGSITGQPILQPGSASPGIITVASQNPNSHWNGSSIVGQALSQFGKVSLQKQGQVLAVNGQPSPLQVANEITYRNGSTAVQSPNAGTLVTHTQGVKVVGFTANFLPLILGDNRILLQYQMQISQLATPLVSDPTTGDQTPNIASQSIPGQAFVKDGQAIVLFGFDDNRDSADTSFSFGGLSKATSNQRQLMVIVMQVSTGVKND